MTETKLTKTTFLEMLATSWLAGYEAGLNVLLRIKPTKEEVIARLEGTVSDSEEDFSHDN